MTHYPLGRPNSDLTELALVSRDTYTTFLDDVVSADDTLNIHINNPDGSGEDLLFYAGEISHEGTVEATVYSSITEVDGGTTNEVHNNYVGRSSPTSATVTKNVTFTADDVHQRMVYVDDGVHRFFDDYRVLVPEGESIVFEALEQSAGNNQMSLRLAFLELESN